MIDLMPRPCENTIGAGNLGLSHAAAVVAGHGRAMTRETLSPRMMKLTSVALRDQGCVQIPQEAYRLPVRV